MRKLLAVVALVVLAGCSYQEYKGHFHVTTNRGQVVEFDGTCSYQNTALSCLKEDGTSIVFYNPEAVDTDAEAVP